MQLAKMFEEKMKGLLGTEWRGMKRSGIKRCG